MKREYCYVLTIQYPAPGGRGFGVSTDSGVFIPGPGQTRVQVYEQLLERMVRATGATRTNTLFFSLEPNALSEVTR